MEIEMPKYVDAQKQILWFEADEFVIAIAILGSGMMMHTIFWPVVALFIIMPMMSKMKRTSLDGAVMHTLCTTGIFPLNDEFDDALEKEFYL